MVGNVRGGGRQYPQLKDSCRRHRQHDEPPGPLRQPETVRNYRPKTGNELATAANIIGFICIFADEQRDRSVWYSRLQTTSGSSSMPKSGGAVSIRRMSGGFLWCVS